MTKQKVFNFFAEIRLQQLLDDSNMYFIDLVPGPDPITGRTENDDGSPWMVQKSRLDYDKISKLTFEFATELLKNYPFDEFKITIEKTLED